MLVTGKKFRNATMQLDGNTFKNCTFTNCKMVFSGYMPVGLENSTFNKVSWSFTGPALTTLGFMRALYAGGGSGGMELIENTLQAIRGEKPTSGQTLH